MVHGYRQKNLLDRQQSGRAAGTACRHHARLNTAASEVSGATGSVRFFPDGSSTGGSVELEANGQAFKINIEWITGRVSIL
ncbi:MAG TPA: GspH/FimT family pseudopilin [Thiolinea sp.]|nr:GspH/FimT family pseudopilin [Thiolinea sp.]